MHHWLKGGWTPLEETVERVGADTSVVKKKHERNATTQEQV